MLFLQLLHLKVVLRPYFLHLALMLLLHLLPLNLLLHKGVSSPRQRRSHS